MGRKSRRKGPSVYQKVQITSLSSMGYGIGKTEDGKILFVEKAAPGDCLDVQIVGRKKKFSLGKIIQIHEAAKDRIKSNCEHADLCGGCKWQHIDYQEQLHWKSQQVKDAFEKIGQFQMENIFHEILPSKETFHYRNKMDFSFTNKKWLMKEEMNKNSENQNGIGLHIPGRFDKVLQLNKCWLQEDLHNKMRKFIFDFAQNHKLTFFDLRKQEGLLRSLIFRNNRLGHWMVILVVTNKTHPKLVALQKAMQVQFPNIISFYTIENTKANDSIFDLEVDLNFGQEFLLETLGGLKFQIRPKSFFQVNVPQAERLFDLALGMVDWSNVNLAYDIYCGTGTITLLAAKRCKKIVGIEAIEQAVEDARENARANQVKNAFFEFGEARKVLSEDFKTSYPNPDLIITDPPRAGMHPDVIQTICALKTPQLLYISCNPATQARDLYLMKDIYDIQKVQPIDMFPQTPHVENIAYLQLK